MRLFPGERHRGDRAGFRAGPLRIGGVLDVAAGKDRAGRRAQGRADLEAGIGRVGVRLRGFCRGEQFGKRRLSAL